MAELDDFGPDVERFFSDCCNGGRLAIVKYIYSKNPEIIKTVKLSPECYKELKILKWLHSIGYDMSNMIDGFLMKCCTNGELEIAKWLVSIGANLHKFDGSLFVGTCHYGKMEVAKWLVTMGINIHAGNDGAIVDGCRGGNLELVKWLYKLGLNVRTRDDALFRAVCWNQYCHILDFLTEVGNYNKEFIDKNIDGFITSRNSLNLLFFRGYEPPINAHSGVVELHKMYHKRKKELQSSLEKYLINDLAKVIADSADLLENIRPDKQFY